MPRAFTKTEQDLIRAKLIAAGKKLINKAGVRRLVVDEIVHEVGISKGSFYTFFPSREDFILSVLESWEAEYRSILLRDVIESSGTTRDRIERFILGAFAIFEKEPGLAHIRPKEIELLIERLPPERLAAHQASDTHVLEAAFAEWGKRGLATPDKKSALKGLIPAIFSVAMHKEDFPPGSYTPMIKLIAESLALRIAEGAGGGKPYYEKAGSLGK